MKNQIEYVFAGGFTAQGYHSYLPDLLGMLERVILLEGAPGSGRSTFIKIIGLTLAERGYRTQFWPSPLDASYVDGVYLRQLRTAITTGNAAAELNVADHPGVEVCRIDLRECCNPGELAGSREEIALLTDQLETIMSGVKTSLGEVQDSRKRLARNYEYLLNAEKLEELTTHLIAEILGEEEQAAHYFARAVTSDGVVDFFEEITGDCFRRYILQGPPGGGKSRLMQRIGEAALSKGHKVGFYHSGLDPDYLEMVVVESMRVALADSDMVRPAARPGDCYIDLTECWDNSRLTGLQPEVREAERLVSNRLYQAIEGLTRARQVEKKLSKLFTKAMQFDQVDSRRDELITEIMAIK